MRALSLLLLTGLLVMAGCNYDPPVAVTVPEEEQLALGEAVFSTAFGHLFFSADILKDKKPEEQVKITKAERLLAYQQFMQIASEYPASSYHPDSLVYAARIAERYISEVKSLQAYSLLLERFPEHAYADEARVKITEKLAGFERQLGDHYSLRKAMNLRTIEILCGQLAVVPNAQGLVFYYRGLVAVSRKLYNQARNYWRLAGDYAPAQVALGLAELQNNRSETAQAFFEQATKSDPNYHIALFNLAYTMEQRGDITAAKLAWKQYLKLVTKLKVAGKWNSYVERHLQKM